MLPMQDVDLAVAEMPVREKGARLQGRVYPAEPVTNNKMIDHPDYEPFWAAAEDLDFSIGFHEGGSAGMPQVGMDRFEVRGARHIITRYDGDDAGLPRGDLGRGLREAPKDPHRVSRIGGGWIAPWLDRMDRHFDDQGFNDSGLKTRPSDLFQRNCWISFEPVEGSLNALADYIGPHKIMWATDYPHPDGFFPGAPDMVRERLKGLSPKPSTRSWPAGRWASTA